MPLTLGAVGVGVGVVGVIARARGRAAAADDATAPTDRQAIRAMTTRNAGSPSLARGDDTQLRTARFARSCVAIPVDVTLPTSEE
jgi:hypothetical protein